MYLFTSHALLHNKSSHIMTSIHNPILPIITPCSLFRLSRPRPVRSPSSLIGDMASCFTPGTALDPSDSKVIGSYAYSTAR